MFYYTYKLTIGNDVLQLSLLFQSHIHTVLSPLPLPSGLFLERGERDLSREGVSIEREREGGRARERERMLDLAYIEGR